MAADESSVLTIDDALPMPALTVLQPWATLLALGAKRNETRSWATRYRGPLAIHAGVGLRGWGRCGTRTRLGAWEVERDQSGLMLRGPGTWPYRLPLGEVVCLLNVVDVKRTDSLELRPPEEELALGNYEPGRFAWQTGSLDRIATRDRRRVRGALGLWEWQAPRHVLEGSQYHRPVELR